MHSAETQATQTYRDQLRQRFCVLSPWNMPSPSLVNASFYAGFGRYLI